MNGRPRILLALCCAAGAFFAAASLAGAHPVVGIADNDTTLFTDPRFLALGITAVHDDIPWNALDSARARARLARWLAAAKADGATPLISFDHDAISSKPRTLPTVRQYSTAFLAFRKAYPWVTEFATWDEANYRLEATANDPQRVAAYYLALRRDCPSCTILAADLVDLPGGREAVDDTTWARELIHYLHAQPGYWGLNDYVGANEFNAASTRRLLAAVRGNVWLAETGGIVSHRPITPPASPARERRAARVDAFILDKLANLSPRVQRVYLYQWSVLSPRAGWDSALISFGGEPRPAYDVLATTLADWGLAPDCAISSAPPACTPSGSSRA